MAAFLDEQLKSYGVETKLVELGDQEIEGQTLKLPPAILGSIGTDPKKKTVLIYGHYDVQPVRSLNRALMLCSKISRTLRVGRNQRRMGHGPVQADHRRQGPAHRPRIVGRQRSSAGLDQHPRGSQDPRP